MADIDTTNKHMVSSNGSGVAVLMPPRGFMDADDAMLFAAWLVAMAEDKATTPFQQVLEAVRNS